MQQKSNTLCCSPIRKEFRQCCCHKKLFRFQLNPIRHLKAVENRLGLPIRSVIDTSTADDDVDWWTEPVPTIWGLRKIGNVWLLLLKKLSAQNERKFANDYRIGSVWTYFNAYLAWEGQIMNNRYLKTCLWFTTSINIVTSWWRHRLVTISALWVIWRTDCRQ